MSRALSAPRLVPKTRVMFRGMLAAAALLASAPALAQERAPPPPGVNFPIAVLRTLDKITGRVRRIEVPIDDELLLHALPQREELARRNCGGCQLVKLRGKHVFNYKVRRRLRHQRCRAYGRSQVAAEWIQLQRRSDTGEEALAAIWGYTAYFGTYTVDEAKKIVTHHRAGSVQPGWHTQKDFVRWYRFEGDDRVTLGGLALCGRTVPQASFPERIDLAARHGHAVPGEDGFGLIFVDIHGVSP